MISSKQIKNIVGLTNQAYYMKKKRDDWKYRDIEKLSIELKESKEDIIKFLRG